MGSFFDKLLHCLGTKNVYNDKMRAFEIYYNRTMQRSVINNLLQFRRNRIAHNFIYRKKGKVFITVLKMLAIANYYDKGMVNIANRVIKRKYFRRLMNQERATHKLKQFRKKQGSIVGLQVNHAVNKSFKKLPMHLMLYPERGALMKRVDQYAFDYKMSRFLLHWSAFVKSYPRRFRVFKSSDNHYERLHLLVAIKTLLHNLGTNRRWRKKLAAMEVKNTLIHHTPTIRFSIN